MSNPARLIIVDDTDPNIRYTGPWTQTNDATLHDADTLGLTLDNTLHALNANGSFSFNFTGNLASTSATYSIDGAAPIRTDPSWVCLVDGNPIPSHVPETPFPNVENNWVLCQSGFLPDGPHHIEVQVTVLSAGGFTFWFDYFEYVPSRSVPLDDATIYVNYTDPAIQYGPGWSISSNSTATTMAEANLAFDFVGVQLTWFGTILANLTLEPTSATFSTYSINGTAPIRFSVPSSLGSLSPNNLTVFKTQQLPPGKHHLEVVHGGNAQTPPLTLQYFVIQNGSTSRTSSTEGNPLQSSSSSSLEPTTLPLPRPHSPPASKF
ncbi:hypothetical protein GALMADRAFT_1326580 [Galerina marginata CBS 339.88]|uniref:Uncharacterized protein n=1 Tax=Galerina marginata (strain CBS 339.88) TaxID=685588 RepID=A0A067T5S3_GALM3|nr:hypothetical protein GALMADRAFT_1326580 [Galerina marginata CBS 339.88]